MIADHQRDAAATVVVCAFFASAWFGWAQDSPPRAWVVPLAVASVGSVLLAVLGALLTWQRWTDGTALDRETAQAFGVVVAVEVVVAGVGAAVLSRSGQGEYTPVWIALVVGVHFIPLAPMLEYPLFYLVAAGVVVAAVVGVPVARSAELPLSAVTGVGTGSVLLAAALFSLATVVP